VLAAHSAAAAAPAGTEPAAFARACLADAYEVLADLTGVRSGIAGPGWTAELLWPGALHLPGPAGIGDLAAGLTGEVDDLVVVPADVPDLPGLVLAKVLRVLPRVDLAVAPEVDGNGCVALGVSLPLADWLEPALLDLDHSPIDRLRDDRVPRSRWALVPSWHRLHTPDDLIRLDPGLEGWEETRALLAGRAP
jgi:hypothetical protein